MRKDAKSTLKDFLVSIARCARCGADHQQLSFQPLKNPPDEFHYFGICPATEQPILLAVKAVGFEARQNAK